MSDHYADGDVAFIRGGSGGGSRVQQAGHRFEATYDAVTSGQNDSPGGEAS